MRLAPKSLAGRLAAMLVLTLLVAQMVSFALFAGERVSAFYLSYREEMIDRLAALVDLLEETPPDLSDRLLATMNSPVFRAAIEPNSSLEASSAGMGELRGEIAEALHKRRDDVRLSAWGRDWRDHHGWGRDKDGSDAEDEEDDERDRRPPHWIGLSVRLDDGRWLNAAAARPPVPPLGGAFLASFVISAVAVALVGAFGVRWASRPLRDLAGAADRLGRGESFVPLPETGPQETRRANVAFNRMRERLDRFIRDRTAMLAAVAHDLRTPITSLRLRAEFVEDEETKAKILETLTEMQVMAEAVLAFARGDAETEPTSRADLTSLVESLVEDAAEAGREVAFEDSPPVALACRPFALRRAVGNLVDNAARYGVRARVRVEAEPGEARIVIEDEGPGIPASELERVFDPFVRLEASRSRETGGAGLGLSIARTIIRSHGGDVRLENRPEGGLRAVVSLPRGEQH
jgi:signal transduction histidine kinase